MDARRFNSQPQTLTSCGSGRRKSTTSNCNSPEFEFWMVRNPSFPQPDLLSADELFSEGVLLPLRLLSLQNKPDPLDQTLQPEPEPPNSESNIVEADPETDLSPAITESSSSTAFSASKRWRDIFKKGEKKNSESNNNAEEKDKEKVKKKERKGGNGASSAELNINIWPFSRSRSAGNAGNRPKIFPGASGNRKVNSAPCSRSNSAGESKSRKWPSSPGRSGVHLGRSSPVWQVRRGGSTLKNSEPVLKGSKKDASESRRSKISSATTRGGSTAKVLNLNVPIGIGYRHHLSCRSDENGAIGVNASTTTNGGANVNVRGNNGGGSGGNLFNLRNLFAKKGIVTSH